VQFHDGPDSEAPERFLAVNARRGDRRRVILDVVGEVDAFTAPLMQACVRSQLSRSGLRELILDMGGVEFLGVAGISVVGEAWRRSRERGVRFRLRSHGRPQVVQPLELSGVIDEIRASEAVEARERSASRKAARQRRSIRGSRGPIAPQPLP
jgi:anti-anti-sigma factor